MKRALPALLALLLGAGAHRAAAYTVVHHFFPQDAFNPRAALVADAGGYLYGTSRAGGTSGMGTVFRMRADGTEFVLLHSFSGADGKSPFGGLVLDGATGTLYGTTINGGTTDEGAVFKVQTDGTGFALVHAFSGATDGSSPASTLCLVSGVLYGTAESAGAGGHGTVFSITTGGAGFNVLHAFAGGVSDGDVPYAGVIADGAGHLFGTTRYGGAAGMGTVYRLRTDGLSFLLLHSFAGSDGDDPMSGLVLDGSGNLYGTTYAGGSSSLGTAFRVSTIATGFTVLRHFSGTVSDGAHPESALLLDGSGNVLGTTETGGAENAGTIFRMTNAGGAFTLLHSFSLTSGLPQAVRSALCRDASGDLFGTMDWGGAYKWGAVYELKADGFVYRVMHAMSGTQDGRGPQSNLLLAGDGYLYGTTRDGGTSGQGVVFRVRPDGTSHLVIHAFTGGSADGSAPKSGLVSDGTWLYGMTTAGGTAGAGTVYKLQPDGTGFTLLYSFTGAADGGYPHGDLVRDASGNLYGCAYQAGTSDKGTLFKLTPAGAFSTLHTFLGGALDGASPTGVVLDGSGNLFGTTYAGGASDGGTVFRIGTNGLAYGLLHTFAGGASDGKRPNAGVVLDGTGSLYGSTFQGGTWDLGTVFRLGVTGSDFGVLHHFAGGASDGNGPWGGVALDPGGQIYGTAAWGGSASNMGVVFTLRSNGAGFTLLHAFAGAIADGSYPEGGVLLDHSGNLLGTTFYGGNEDSGTLFVIPSVCTFSDVTPPVVTPPLSIEVMQTLCCGTFGGASGATEPAITTFLAGGSAVEACSSATRLPPRAGGVDADSSTCFGAGPTNVVFRYQDDNGNVGTGTSSVYVRMYADLNLDDVVDTSDMVVLRAYLNFAVTPGTNPFLAPLGTADLTHEGNVDPSDLVVLRAYFNFAVACLAP